MRTWLWWVGCGSAPPAELGAPEVAWTGSEPVAVGEPIAMDAALAAQLAAERGAPAVADRPDLGGTWTRVDPLPDGMRSTATSARRQVAPGVYDVRAAWILDVDGVQALRVDLVAWETFGERTACSFTRRATASYAVPDIAPILAPLVDRFAPTTLNEAPCTPLVTATADQLIGLRDDGSTYLETRSP